MAIPATSPSTNVTFYKGCTLNKDYQHVFYYADQAAQDGYFNTLTSKTYNTILYQNLSDNTLRVGIPIKDLLGYNYFTFINDNSSYERKKFYCFIDNMTSINNNTTEVRYTVDVFNTFAFDYYTQECYIKRQHAVNDNLYKHIEPEPITDGVYTTNKQWLYDDNSQALSMSQMGAILIVNEDPNLNYKPAPLKPHLAGKSGELIHECALIWAANSSDLNAAAISGLPLILHNFIVDGHSENILACYMCPNWIINGLNPNPSGPYQSLINTVYATRTLSFSINHNTLDGYTPHNKKLFTYPYRYFNVLSTDGTGEVLKYELNNNTNLIMLEQFGVAVGQNGVNVVTVPLDYAGVSENWNHNLSWNYNEQILVSRDNVADWWRSNGDAVALSAMSSILSSASGLIAQSGSGSQSTAFLGAFMSANNIATGVATQVARMEDAPTKSFGNCNTSAGKAGSFLGVFCYDICYRKKDLERIDAFFDRYGYAVDALGVPNQYCRENFTYIQTAGSNVKSKGTNYLNAEFINQINSAFDRGITFWYSGGLNAYSNIGNFSKSVISSNDPLEF